MINIPDIGADITERFTRRARSVASATVVVKVFLVVGGASLIALAECVTLPMLDKKPVWAALGIIGTIFAFVGGLFLAFTERDVAIDLAAAQKALESAREAEADYAEIGIYAEEIRRSAELYGACRLMLSALQQMSLSPSADDTSLADQLLDVAEWPIRVALGFKTTDHWSIGIYQIQERPSGKVLKALALRRSEKCDVKDAREWAEGKGAGWIALANGTDTVIPDLANDAMGSIFDGAISKSDAERYRSIAVSPIFDNGEKWGMVIATSDCPNHFSLEDVPGVRPAEGVHALQKMISLALALRRFQLSSVAKS